MKTAPAKAKPRRHPAKPQQSNQPNSKWHKVKRVLDNILGGISPLAIVGTGWNLWDDFHASPIHAGVVAFDTFLFLGWICIFVNYFFLSKDGVPQKHEKPRAKRK